MYIQQVQVVIEGDRNDEEHEGVTALQDFMKKAIGPGKLVAYHTITDVGRRRIWIARYCEGEEVVSRSRIIT